MSKSEFGIAGGITGSYCPGINLLCSGGSGGGNGGAITIRHGGGLTTPFNLSNASVNGIAGNIDATPSGTVTVGGAIPIPPNTFDSYTYNAGVINIVTALPPAPPPTTPTLDPTLFPLLQNPPPPPAPAPVIAGTPPAPEPIAIAELVEPPTPSPVPSPSPSPILTPITIPSPQPIIIPIPTPTPRLFLDLPRSLLDLLLRTANPLNTLPTLGSPQGSIPIVTSPAIEDISARLASLESYFQLDFEQYLGMAPQDFGKSYKLAEVQNRLNEITQATGSKPALIYVFFAPQDGSNNFTSSFNLASQNSIAKENDPLEVILVTGKAKPIRVQLSGTTRRQVLAIANEFRSDVTNFRSSRGFLAPAQKMHQWILESLEEELQKQGIDNLIFLVDTGLRSTPLAAMHDRQGFIIERYSVALMPSLNLVKLNYDPLENAQVLAMGATTFPNSGLAPLPAVSLELSTISQLWRGSEFLNDRFTLNNLIQQRQERSFQIVHLATHGSFNPGDRANSYIQLWDQRLNLNQLDQLNWINPPVDLLVLSACQTALGDREAELGFAGLSINAGVRSALASLWRVNDAATLGLMAKFYQQLQRTTTKAEALRQAQLAMLKGEVRLEDGNLVLPSGVIPLTEDLRSLGDRRLSHPYYWSAFTIVGNPW